MGSALDVGKGKPREIEYDARDVRINTIEEVSSKR